METVLILSGKATLEDLYILHGLGYEFTVDDGTVTHIEKGEKG